MRRMATLNMIIATAGKRILNSLFSGLAIIWIAIFMSICLHLKAQDTTMPCAITLNGYISEMPSLQFSSIAADYEFSNQLHNRLNFKVQTGTHLTAALELRTRFYYYGSDTNITSYYKLFEQDAGVVRLSKNIISGNNYVLNMAVDRLWIDYSTGKWQFTLGRQRINWGQTFVWNPNDIFNTYNYLDFDYVEKPGSDAIRVQYYTSETSKAELVVKADSSRKPSVAGLYRFNRRNYDIQFLAGLAGEDVVIGSGWSGQLAKGGVRGEISYFIPTKEFPHSKGELTSSVGWDYMFKNSLFLQLECLYNGNHADSTGINILDNNSFKISAQNPFLSGFSYFASASYPVTPLFNCSLAGIINPENKVCIIVPSLDYNLLQNLDVSFLAQLIGFKTPPNPLATVSIWFLRIKYSF